MTQICVPETDRCVDCSEYAAAFSCLKKVKISEIDRLSDLDIEVLLDDNCADIIIPVSTIDCDGKPVSKAMTLTQLKDIIGPAIMSHDTIIHNITEEVSNTIVKEVTNTVIQEVATDSGHTSIGDRKSFPDRTFTGEGQESTYELEVYNTSKTRSMQVSYIAQWSTYIAVEAHATSGGEAEVVSDIYVDGVEISGGGGYNTTVGAAIGEHNFQDAGSVPAVYTKVIAPQQSTKLTMKLRCTLYDGAYVKVAAETLQLMITGTTI